MILGARGIISYHCTGLVGICNTRHSDIEFTIQLMMLKQFQLKDSFLSCLKANAMDIC